MTWVEVPWREEGLCVGWDRITRPGCKNLVVSYCVVRNSVGAHWDL